MLCKLAGRPPRGRRSARLNRPGLPPVRAGPKNVMTTDDNTDGIYSLSFRNSFSQFVKHADVVYENGPATLTIGSSPLPI